MARSIQGIVSWIDNIIYTGKTPISWKHFQELEDNIKLINVDIDYHRSLETYEAHKAVSLTQSGFITPEIIKEIDKIADRLTDLGSRVRLRVPAGIIVMYDGLPSKTPEGWYFCDGLSGTPDIRGKYVLGGSITATYPLHSSSDGETDIDSTIGKASSMLPHSHDIYNCWCCYPNASENNGTTFRNPIPNDLRLASWDWDNSAMYYVDQFDYVGGNSSLKVKDMLPKTIKVPFIMRGNDALKDCVITVHQPTEGGQILLQGNKVNTLTVKQNSIVKVEFEVDDAYAITEFTVDGESRGTPCYVQVYDDMSIIGRTGQKIVNVIVEQTGVLDTLVNGELVTNKDYVYGTALNFSTESKAGYAVVDYKITERGWSGKMKDTESGSIVTQSISDDPEPIVDLDVPFSENIETKSRTASTTSSTVNFEIPEDGTYRVKADVKLYNDFFGYRGTDAEVVLEAYLDQQVQSTNTLSYLDNGEILVNSVYSAMKLEKGKHVITFKLTASAGTATLTSQITGGSVQISEIGVVV